MHQSNREKWQEVRGSDANCRLIPTQWGRFGTPVRFLLPSVPIEWVTLTSCPSNLGNSPKPFRYYDKQRWLWKKGDISPKATQTAMKAWQIQTIPKLKIISGIKLPLGPRSALWNAYLFLLAPLIAYTFQNARTCQRSQVIIFLHGYSLRAYCSKKLCKNMNGPQILCSLVLNFIAPAL